MTKISFCGWFFLALAAPAVAQVVAPRAVAPLLLQAKDAAQPVFLQSATIDTQVAGGLAQTDIEMVFANPNDRLLEGQLVFPLRPGQDIVGFALDINGEMRPAVPVDKARGREVFEKVERRRVDPALLEKTQGNFFRLRIYPIPARGVRRVRISLSESLERIGDQRQLRIPLDFASGLQEVPLRIHGGSPDVFGAMGGLKFSKEGSNFIARLQPIQLKSSAGVALRWPVEKQAQVQVQRFADESYFVAEVAVPGEASPRPLPRRVGLLWDASGSGRKRDVGLEIAVLDGYFKALGNADVRLVVLRDRSEIARTFSVVDGDWSSLKQALKGVVYDGATNLNDWQPEPGIQEYLLVSDGLSNYGGGSFPKLAEQQRLFALSSAGASADSGRLGALALGHGGRLIELASPAEIDGALTQLLTDAPRLVSIDAVGARDVVSESPFSQAGVLRLAGRVTSPGARLNIEYLRGGSVRRATLSLPDQESSEGQLVPRTWASYRIRALAAEPEQNRAQIRTLGQRFGIATGETSLIVLETLDDYLRYDVVPPPSLQAEFQKQRQGKSESLATERAGHLEEIVAEFAEKQAWWEQEWPKKAPPKVSNRSRLQSPTSVAAPAVVFDAPSPASADMSAPSENSTRTLERVEVTGSRVKRVDEDDDAADISSPSENVGADSNSHARTITLQPWQPDSPFARRLRAAGTDRIYAMYLDEREAHADSTAFYLDVADILLAKGQRDLALRVLSNLAEMQLENRDVLRVLGYRLMQAKAADLAVPVLQRVLAIAEEEPQSYRDLGLAYAAAKQPQKAIESLYEVAVRPWDDRFGGIAMIALAELNSIVANSPQALDTRMIDKRLLRNLPLSMRAVLTWDGDNTDMDLWVTQPDGERCYYQNPLTAVGGQISKDFTGGYGPEEYSLRRAPPGKYKVEVNYYGSSAQLLTGAVTVQLWLSTAFGTPQQKDQWVTLRLEDKKQTVLVGEFEIR